MKSFHRRSDDWLYGSLLAAVLAAAAGVQGAWLREARPQGAAAHAGAASGAPVVVAAAVPAHHGSR